MKYWHKIMGLFLVLILIAGILSGCSNKDIVSSSSTIGVPTESSTPLPTVDVAEVLVNAPVITESEDAATNVAPSIVPLTDIQRSSISMLNNLVVFTQEVNASKNSRLSLEEAYSSLYNNTHPNAVDARTQVEINYLFDRIEEYRMVAVKRDRLQYIYEQNRAQALRKGIPNPLGLISAVQSFSLSKLVASVVYMAADSVASYQSGTAHADLQFLQDGWALNDEQAITLHNLRKGTFNYMVETVREYDLPGDLALTENAVDNFVKWKGYSNNLQKIQLFESNVGTYQAFGPYWLVLAECYYENGDYDKCLAAIEHYEALDLKIFRKDHQYASTLPLAIVAAEHVLTEDDYVSAVGRYTTAIINNTDYDEWAHRYFAAQTYIGLFAKTGDTSYLTTAYNLVVNNVSFLLDEQKFVNTVYLADVQETATPKDATEIEKKEISQYNKLQKEERKTALPPIYEPLLLNCELLFALTQEINIPEAEAIRIDGILHENGEALFLTTPIDQMYWFASSRKTDASVITTTFNGSEFTLPVQYVTDNAYIKVTVTQGDEITVFDDWKVTKVERKEKDNLSSFMAFYSSTTAQKFKYSPDAMIVIEVVPHNSSEAEPLCFRYSTVAAKTWIVFDTVNFQRVEE